MWIKRDITESLVSNSDVIQILRGPRQCGKSSLFLHVGPEFKEVSLDDPSLRSLAQTDPTLFLKQFGDEKILIDEAQYAPELFPVIKRRVDLLKRNKDAVVQTMIRITGSNQILMDRTIKESLAGRASYFDLNTLSLNEILSVKDLPVSEMLFKGGWPELYAQPNKDVRKYLDDYITSYVEKDIVLTAGIQKQREFLKFLRLLAGRVGQIVDLAGLGADCGVDAKTAKEWLSVLENMHVVAVVEPFYSNLSKRLIKSPKFYFLDTGLACRLQGWAENEPILTSPQLGSLFENLVFSEIVKTRTNFQKDWKIFHWRSRDGEEVDFVVQISPLNYLLVEAKVTAQKVPHSSQLKEAKKVFGKSFPELIQCVMEGEQILGPHIPIKHLTQFLLDYT